MKKLIASVLAVLICLSFSAMLISADPGAEPTTSTPDSSAPTSSPTDSSTSSSVPPGYVVIWMPEGVFYTNGTDTIPATTDDNGWTNPQP
jgi:hypothetical protein